MTMGKVPSGRANLPNLTSTASLWHSKPSKLLLGHRTTKHLPTKADVVVIGSGITGAFAAHYLSNDVRGKDLDVVMLEAREACWGATGRNGGHCQPKIYTNLPQVARFELENFETIRTLIKENKIACEWQDVDSCHGYTSSSLFETEVAAVHALRSLDPELGNMVTIVTSESQNPSLTDLRLGHEVVGAIVQKSSASLSPYKLVAWILERLVLNNTARQSSRETEGGSFNLQTSTSATCLQRLKDDTWVVHTPRGMLAAKQILLATNAYTSYLLPEFSNFIIPVRGQMSALLPPRAMCPDDGAPLAGKHSYGFYGRGTGIGSSFNQDDYLVQRPFPDVETDKIGGELMLGGGRQYADDFGIGISDDSDIEQPVAGYLRLELTKVLDIPENKEELCASYEWSGVMGFSTDGRPYVGQVPDSWGGGEGLWICAGFTGHGMPNATLCAKAVADMMMGTHAKDVNLPPEYHLPTERLEMAKKLVPPLLPGCILENLAL